MSQNTSINHFCDERSCRRCCSDSNIELEESPPVDDGILDESNAKLNRREESVLSNRESNAKLNQREESVLTNRESNAKLNRREESVLSNKESNSKLNQREESVLSNK
jgi:hypothetical protein